MSLTRISSLLPSRSAAARVSSVDWPLTCNTRAKVRMRSDRSFKFKSILELHFGSESDNHGTPRASAYICVVLYYNTGLAACACTIHIRVALPTLHFHQFAFAT